MKKIKIKRSETNGLMDAEGYFVERFGFQFCAVKRPDISRDFWNMIELSTGCSAMNRTSKSFKYFLELFDGFCDASSEQKLKDAIEIAKRDFAKYIDKFPVNKPI